MCGGSCSPRGIGKHVEEEEAEEYEKEHEKEELIEKEKSWKGFEEDAEEEDKNK